MQVHLKGNLQRIDFLPRTSPHSHLRRKHSQHSQKPTLSYQRRKMETDLVTHPHHQKLLFRLMQQRPCALSHHHTLELHPPFPITLDMMIINLMGTGCLCLDRAVRHEGLDPNAEEIDRTTIEGRLDTIAT
jgi:hypothetical protein